MIHASVEINVAAFPDQLRYPVTTCIPVILHNAGEVAESHSATGWQRLDVGNIETGVYNARSRGEILENEPNSNKASLSEPEFSDKFHFRSKQEIYIYIYLFDIIYFKIPFHNINLFNKF